MVTFATFDKARAVRAAKCRAPFVLPVIVAASALFVRLPATDLEHHDLGCFAGGYRMTPTVHRHLQSGEYMFDPGQRSYLFSSQDIGKRVEIWYRYQDPNERNKR